VRAQTAQVLELPECAARVSSLALSGMPHDATHSSLPTEPSAEPIFVESRAVPETAWRSLRQASDAASSSSSASCVATATSSSVGRSSRQSTSGAASSSVITAAAAVVVRACRHGL
jgi:hypothetical protein